MNFIARFFKWIKALFSKGDDKPTEPQFVVLEEVDGAFVTRSPVDNTPTTLEKALERANLQNFEFVICVSGQGAGFTQYRNEAYVAPGV